MDKSGQRNERIEEGEYVHSMVTGLGEKIEDVMLAREVPQLQIDVARFLIEPMISKYLRRSGWSEIERIDFNHDGSLSVEDDLNRDGVLNARDCASSIDYSL